MKQIWFAFLPERCVYDVGFNVGLQIAYRAGQKGYHPIVANYGRTDITRQGIALAFLQVTSNHDDTLVMLDIDHEHPLDVIDRLIQHDAPVVTPLMFRRGAPFEACAFLRGADNELHNLASFPEGLFQVAAVGSGAIAIQRHVFTTLQARGHEFFFKYEYFDTTPTYPARAPSEDLYFSKLCEQAGIALYVDTTFETPHLIFGHSNKEMHELYMSEHPDALGEKLYVATE